MFYGENILLVSSLLASGCTALSHSEQITRLVAKVTANKCSDNQLLLIAHLLTGAVSGLQER